jgi:hypothetical protein
MLLDCVVAESSSVFLVNCDVEAEIPNPRILAGIAYLRGGLTEWVKVFDLQGRVLGEIRISPSVQRVETQTVLYSKNDDLEFELRSCLK